MNLHRLSTPKVPLESAAVRRAAVRRMQRRKLAAKLRRAAERTDKLVAQAREEKRRQLQWRANEFVGRLFSKHFDGKAPSKNKRP